MYFIVALDFFNEAPTIAKRDGDSTFSLFNEEEYEGDWIFIGRFLTTLMINPSWTREEIFDSIKPSTLGHVKL